MGCSQCKPCSSKQKSKQAPFANGSSFSGKDKRKNSTSNGVGTSHGSGGKAGRGKSLMVVGRNVANWSNGTDNYSIRSGGSISTASDSTGKQTLHLFSDVKTLPEISVEEKAVILNTWKVVRENVSRVGVIVFMG